MQPHQKWPALQTGGEARGSRIKPRVVNNFYISHSFIDFNFFARLISALFCFVLFYFYTRLCRMQQAARSECR